MSFDPAACASGVVATTLDEVVLMCSFGIFLCGEAGSKGPLSLMLWMEEILSYSSGAYLYL